MRLLWTLILATLVKCGCAFCSIDQLRKVFIPVGGALAVVATKVRFIRLFLMQTLYNVVLECRLFYCICTLVYNLSTCSVSK